MFPSFPVSPGPRDPAWMHELKRWGDDVVQTLIEQRVAGDETTIKAEHSPGGTVLSIPPDPALSASYDSVAKEFTVTFPNVSFAVAKAGAHEVATESRTFKFDLPAALPALVVFVQYPHLIPTGDVAGTPTNAPLCWRSIAAPTVLEAAVASDADTTDADRSAYTGAGWQFPFTLVLNADGTWLLTQTDYPEVGYFRRDSFAASYWTITEATRTFTYSFGGASTTIVLDDNATSTIYFGGVFGGAGAVAVDNAGMDWEYTLATVTFASGRVTGYTDLMGTGYRPERGRTADLAYVLAVAFSPVWSNGVPVADAGGTTTLDASSITVTMQNAEFGRGHLITQTSTTTTTTTTTT